MTRSKLSSKVLLLVGGNGCQWRHLPGNRLPRRSTVQTA